MTSGSNIPFRCSWNNRSGNPSTWITTKINQPISIGIAYLAYCSGLTPNFVSAFSLITSLLATTILWFATDSKIGIVVAATLFYFSYLLDSADGQLARCTDQKSEFGSWFDHVADAAKVTVMNGILGWILISNAAAYGIPVASCFIAFLLNFGGWTVSAVVWHKTAQHKTPTTGQNKDREPPDRGNDLAPLVANYGRVTRFFSDHTIFCVIPLLLLVDVKFYFYFYIFYGLNISVYAASSAAYTGIRLLRYGHV